MPMSPALRQWTIEGIEELRYIEQHNTNVMIGDPKYAGRNLLSADDALNVIRVRNPEAADEIARRYAGAKILPTDDVAKARPIARLRLLSEGDQASLRDLAVEASVDGYQFGELREKRTRRKRRVPIAGESAGVPLQ
jgi:hypothetical protein